jgi:hypothetical protein
MSKTAVFNWPLPAAAGIAALQTVGAGASMILNGTLNPFLNPVVTLTGISRKVSLTSTANLSGVNFTITGTYLGKPQVEITGGPNNNTIETAALFHTVSSVTADISTAANTVSIGTGSDGHTNPYMVDTYCKTCEISAHVVMTAGAPGDITYTFKSSSQLMDEDFNVAFGRDTMYNMVSAQALSVIGAHGMLPLAGTGNTPPDYNIPCYGNLPINWCWIAITSDLTSPASLIAYIIQQGVN